MPPGARIAGPADIPRQGRIMAALHGRGLPTPRIVLSSSEPRLSGRPFVLMERVEGLRIEALVNDVAAHEVARAAVDLMHRLHAVPPAETGIGDAAWTYLFGQPTPEVARLAACGKESLRRGVRELRPGNRFLDFAKAVQGYAEGECGYHLIRGLGGHGYGQTLHAAPFVANTLPTYPGEWPDANMPCRPGILVAVEPMIAVGTGQTEQNPGVGKKLEWPVFTKDGSLSVHYEHDVLITENGPRILTEGLEETRDIIE